MFKVCVLKVELLYDSPKLSPNVTGWLRSGGAVHHPPGAVPGDSPQRGQRSLPISCFEPPGTVKESHEHQFHFESRADKVNMEEMSTIFLS